VASPDYPDYVQATIQQVPIYGSLFVDMPNGMGWLGTCDVSAFQAISIHCKEYAKHIQLNLRWFTQPVDGQYVCTQTWDIPAGSLFSWSFPCIAPSVEIGYITPGGDTYDYIYIFGISVPIPSTVLQRPIIISNGFNVLLAAAASKEFDLPPYCGRCHALISNDSGQQHSYAIYSRDYTYVNLGVVEADITAVRPIKWDFALGPNINHVTITNMGAAADHFHWSIVAG